MTRRHDATLPGSMESYGERTQTHTFESHAKLLAYLASWPLYFPENGFQGAIERSPFLAFAQVFSALIIRKKNCQNGLLLKNSYRYVYCQLSINYVRGHIDDPPTLN